MLIDWLSNVRNSIHNGRVRRRTHAATRRRRLRSRGRDWNVAAEVLETRTMLSAVTFSQPTYDFGDQAEQVDMFPAPITVGTVTANYDPADSPPSLWINSANGGPSDVLWGEDDGNGNLTIYAQGLDFESMTSPIQTDPVTNVEYGTYTLNVIADDWMGNSDSAQVTFDVTDVAEDPVFNEDPYNFDVPEDAETVGTVSATDPQGDDVFFWIESGNEDGHFLLEEDGMGNATIKVNPLNPLDYETLPNSYALSVVADDTMGNSDTTTVNINVIDAPEAPVFDQATYTFDVDEDKTVVGTVSAPDPQGDYVSFSIDSGNEDMHFYILNDNDESATIYVDGYNPLDFETLPNSYSLTILAEDPDGHSDTATVDINVLDVAEAPVFDQASYTFDSPEDKIVIGTFSATDLQGDYISFSIDSGNEDQHFYIVNDNDESATIYVDGYNPLDFETLPNSYSLTVLAEDADGHSDTATVDINVLDVADTPEFDSLHEPDVYNLYVDEDKFEVGTLTASDPQGHFLSFSILSGNDDLHFYLDDDPSGESTTIRVDGTNPLDYETRTSYVLTVEAKSLEDGDTDKATVNINVTDANEAPGFPRVLADQNNLEGATIDLTIDASDVDVGDDLTFSATNLPDGLTPLEVTPSGTGVETAKITGRLTSSAVGTHQVTVTATDSGGLSASFQFVWTIDNFSLAVHELAYTSGHTVYSDPYYGATQITSTEYSAPHWVDSDGDGNPETQHPYAYHRTQKATMDVDFTTANTWSSAEEVIIKADGPGTNDGQTTVSTSGAVSVSGLQIATAFADVEYLSAFGVDWKFSIDGGTTWESAGSTENPIYVTYNTPASKLYRTVVHIGTVNAAGSTTDSAVIDGIWGEFSDRIVKPFGSNTPLTYYANNFAGCPPGGTKVLLVNGDGQCSTWANFLNDTIAAQGASGTSIVTVTASAASTYQGFMVKEWSAPVGATGPYLVSNMTRSTTGLKGQGDILPAESVFGLHYLVKHTDGNNTVYYDPYYGGNEHASKTAWVTASIDFFVKEDGLENLLAYEYNSAQADSLIDFS